MSFDENHKKWAAREAGRTGFAVLDYPDARVAAALNLAKSMGKSCKIGVKWIKADERRELSDAVMNLPEEDRSRVYLKRVVLPHMAKRKRKQPQKDV